MVAPGITLPADQDLKVGAGGTGKPEGSAVVEEVPDLAFADKELPMLVLPIDFYTTTSLSA